MNFYLQRRGVRANEHGGSIAQPLLLTLSLEGPALSLANGLCAFALHALLRFRSQSILSLLAEDSDAIGCGREVVHRWNHHDCFLYFNERTAIRPEALFRNALALHRTVSRRPHGGHLRRVA